MAAPRKATQAPYAGEYDPPMITPPGVDPKVQSFAPRKRKKSTTGEKGGMKFAPAKKLKVSQFIIEQLQPAKRGPRTPTSTVR